MQVPKLPDVQPSGQPAPYQRIDTSAEDFGAGVGRATERLGGAGAQLGNTIADNQLRMQGLKNETMAKESDIRLSQTLTNLQFDPQDGYMTKLGKDAVDGYAGIYKSVQDAFTAERATLPNDQARRMYDNNALRRVEYSQSSMASHAAQQNKAWILDTGKARIANEINTRALAWNDDKSIQQGLGTIAGETADLLALQGRSDPESLKAATSHYQSELVGSAIHQAIAQETTGNAQPGTAGAMLKQYADRLDAAHLASITSAVESHNYTMQMRKERDEAKADREGDRQAAKLRVGVEQSVQNGSAMIADGQVPVGLPGPKEVALAYPNDPERAEMVNQHVRDMQTLGVNVARLPSMTAAEVDKATSDLKPTTEDVDHYAEKSRLYQLWSRSVEGYYKRLVQDPAGTTASLHPEIGAQLKASATDPSAFPVYANSVLSAQAIAGVPQDQRSVLPMAAAQTLADNVMSDPETAPAKMKGLKQQYGDYWPMVLRDMSTVKGGLPPQYQAIGTLDNERDASLLARWMAEGKKANKTADDLLGTKPVSDIRTFVRSDPSVQAYLSSLSRSGASASQTAGILASIDDLAFARSFYDRDPKAADAAVHSFVDKYAFLPEGGARVPVKLYDNIRSSAGQTLRRLQAEGDKTEPGQIPVAVPEIFGKVGMPKQDEYLRVLRASPTWITAPNSDALWLMDPYGRIVRNKAGSPVTVPFDQQPEAPGQLDSPDWLKMMSIGTGQ